MRTKESMAIERLIYFQPPEGYYLAFSGGKDSIVLYDLAVKSGVKFDAHFNNTTVEAPETYKFIKQHYPKVEWHKPEINMFNLIIKKGFPPTRLVRYCCSELKERGGEKRFVLTGIRSAESRQRAQRKMMEFCNKSKLKKYLHPIIDWEERDVWHYIGKNNLPYNSLYDCGYSRIGCILCPMQYDKNRDRDRDRYPNYVRAYTKAFDTMLKVNKGRIMRGGKIKEYRWKTGQEVFDWWVSDGKKNKTHSDMGCNSIIEDKQSEVR